MNKIKIAQVGTWHDHALQTYQCISKLTDTFDVVGIAEPTDTKRDKFDGIEITHTVDELLAMPDLDAVCIECEEENTTMYAQMFADKGIAVHLDKPGSEDISAFEKLIDTVKENKIPFQVAYMYRYNPLVMRCIEEVRQGKLGEIYSIEAQMSVCHPLDKQRWLGKFKGGMMYFLGCHLIDLILQIQGQPKDIITLNQCTNNELLNGARDFGFVVFEYENGSSFIKSCASEVNGFERRQLVVTGSKGTFEIKPFERMLNGSKCDLVSKAHITYKDKAGDIWVDCSEEVVCEPFDRYVPMMLEFAEVIRDEKENPYTYDYELELFKTVMKCCNVI